MDKQPRINNSLFQKNSNIALVASLIWQEKEIPRADIARRLNLYRSTVTNITNYLLVNGVIEEGEVGESCSRGGRRPVALSVNRSFGAVLGIDVKLTHYRAVLMDISGASIWEKSCNAPVCPIDDLLDTVLEDCFAAVERIGIPLLGVCFGLPGMIDREKGIIRYSEPLHIRKPYNVYEYFSSRCPVPVLIENDANCCSWYEMMKHRSEASSVVMYGDYIESDIATDERRGIGIGLGLSADSNVFRGSHSSAGEFCSASWHDSDAGQTGIPDSRVRNILEDRDVWQLWIKDVFSSFIPVVSIFDPAEFIITGEPFRERESDMEAVIADLCPGFTRVLEKYGCALRFDTEDGKIVARGAAMMYLRSLFSVPGINDIGSSLHFEWDKVISAAKQGNYWMKQEQKGG